jgi:multidrug resistance protein, MATE family
MMLANVTEPMIGLADTAAIGRLGQVHLLGAVAIGAIVFDMLFWGLGSLRLSTAGLTAQAHGSGRDTDVSLALFRALLIAVTLGLALIALQRPIMAATFALMKPTDAVREAAETYIAIRIWSGPFALTNYAVLGSLIGRGRTGLGLGLQVLINLTKVALTIALVAFAGLGIAGAALATVAAEIIGALAGLVLMARMGSFSTRDMSWSAVVARPALVRTLAVNRDVAIRTVALLTAFAFFTAQGSRAGDVTLAANAVLYNLFLFGAYFLDGFATAAEQLCGQALGSRDERGFRRAARLALLWSIAVGLAVSLLILVGGPVFIDFVTTNPVVREAARGDLVFAAATAFLGAAAFAFDGIYVGATWTRAMRDLMLLSLALYFLTFFLTRSLGNEGLWFSLVAFLAVRGLGQGLLYPHLLATAFPPGAAIKPAP